MKTIRTILATFGVTSLFYGLFALIAMRLNPAFTGRTIFQLFRDTGFVALVIGIGCVLSFVIMTIAIVSFRDDGGRKKREYSDDEEDEFLEEETVPEERADEADETWSPEIKRKQRRALQATDEDEEEIPDLFGDEDEGTEGRPFVRPTRLHRPEQPERRPAVQPTEQGPQADPEQPSFVRRTSFDPMDEPTIRPAAPAHRAYAEEEAEPTIGRPFAAEKPETPSEPEPEPAPEEGALKRCVYCGKPIDADSAFCIYCGKRV